MKYEAKSIIIGRKPRIEGNQYKTAFIKIYHCEKPIYTEEFPEKELDFPNIEYVKFDTQMDYYLEGNDLVIDNISGVEVSQEGNALIVKPY